VPALDVPPDEPALAPACPEAPVPPVPVPPPPEEHEIPSKHAATSLPGPRTERIS
jgi:hypothetical protein